MSYVRVDSCTDVAWVSHLATTTCMHCIATATQPAHDRQRTNGRCDWLPSPEYPSMLQHNSNLPTGSEACLDSDKRTFAAAYAVQCICMSRRTDLPLQSDYHLLTMPDTAGSLHVNPRNSTVHFHLHGMGSPPCNRDSIGLLHWLLCIGCCVLSDAPCCSVHYPRHQYQSDNTCNNQANCDRRKPLFCLYTSHLVRGMRGAESHQQQPPKGETRPACLADSSSRAVSSCSRLRQTIVAAGSSNPGQQGGPLTKHTQYLCSTVVQPVEKSHGSPIPVNYNDLLCLRDFEQFADITDMPICCGWQDSGGQAMQP